jgi:hypothetical protein
MFRFDFGGIDDNQNFKWNEIKKVMFGVNDIRGVPVIDLEDIEYETRKEIEEVFEKIKPFIDPFVVNIVKE